MPDADTDTSSAQRSTDKRRAILRGGLVTFAQEGYSRASIEAIAQRAEVSTRTIYNHFGNKARLFEVVIQASATEVANSQIALIDRYLHKVTDIEADLLEFGLAWAAPMPEYADHFALVRQVHAEIAHLPPAVLEAWQEAGPRRVNRALAEKLRELGERGLLRIGDPERACDHFALLTAGEVSNRTCRGALPIAESEFVTSVTAGVHTFLYGHSA